MKHNVNKAFTLIEVLIAMGIAMALITMSAYAQINFSDATERSLALASLDLQASTLVKKMRDDFAGMQPHCAAHFHISGTADPEIINHLTFMRGVAFEMDEFTRPEDLWNSYNVSTAKAGQWFHDLVWVRWQFDEEHGLRRAVSPKLEGLVKERGGDKTRGKGDSSYFYNARSFGRELSLPTNMNGKAVVPQRLYKDFDNFGDSENPLTPVATAQVNAWIYDWKAGSGVPSYFGITSGFYFDGEPYMDYLPMYNTAEDQHYFLGNNAPIANAYASSLPYPNRPDEHHPGLPVLMNKNRLDLLGVPGDEDNAFYPTQLALVHSGVELFEMQLLLADNSVLKKSATTLTQEIDGVRLTPGVYLPASASGQRSTMAGERLYTLGKRPKLLRITFIMHNMPIDPTRPYKEDPLAADFPGEDNTSIHYLRHVFYDQLTSADQTAATFKRMIEAAGYTAIEVQQSIAVY